MPPARANWMDEKGYRHLLSFGPLIADCCQAHIFELSDGKVVALVPSQLVGVAETARARVIHGLPARHEIARTG